MIKIKNPKFGKTLIGLTFGLMAVFVFLPYIMLNGAAAEDVSITIGVDVLDLALNTGSEDGNVTFDTITPTSDGTLLLGKKDITVTTNALWYSVYLSTSSSDTTLCPRTVSGSCSSTSTIQSVSTKGASFVQPYSFYPNDMKDTWGFAITPYNSSSTVDKIGGFASANNYYMGDGIEYKSFEKPSSKTGTYGYASFAPVLKKGDDTKIYSDAISNQTKYKNGFAADNGENIIVCNGSNESICNSKGPGKFSIYYGARVTNSLMMGEYKNTVVYTAIAALKDLSTGDKETAYMAPIFGGEGDSVTVSLNMTGTADIRKDEVAVWFVDHAMYESHFSGTITDALLAQYGARCVVNSDSDISEGTISGNTGVSIKCLVPDLDTPLGSNNSDSGHNTIVARDNDYDIVVRIPAYNLTFTTYKEGTDALAFKYAGLFDKDQLGNYYVKYMQDVTHGICALTKTWDTTGWTVGNTTQTWSGTGDPKTIANFDANDAFFAVKNANSVNTKTMASNYGAPYNPNTMSEWSDSELTVGQKWEKNMINNLQRELEDSRDGKKYIVRKLADGNCWMVQNLDLDLQDNIQLTAADTDLNSKSSWVPSNTGFNTGAKKLTNDASRGTYIVTQRGSESGSSYPWAQTGSDGAHAYDLGNSFFNITIPQSEPTATGTNSTVTYPSISNYGNQVDCQTTSGGPGTEQVAGTIYSNLTTTCKADTRNAGNYYNWYAATAGTGTASLSSATSVQAYELEADGETKKLDGDGNPILKFDAAGNPVYSVVSGDAQDSICPRGWKLAAYTGAGSYKYLMDTYNMTSNDNGIQRAPLSFVRGGNYYYSNGSLYNRGSNGYYWETRVNSGTLAYFLTFYSTSLRPQYYYNKGYGFPLRCLVR